MSMPFKHRYTPDLDKLWIVVVISNPVRYKTRYELYQKFKAEMDRAGVNVFTVELAQGDRPFEVTTNDPTHCLQLRTYDEIWHKENMVNLALQRLPPDWKYVCWADGDIHFVEQNWPDEIVHELQHYSVVQCFQHCIDLGPDGELMGTYEGLAASYLKGRVYIPQGVGNEYGYGKFFHTGYVWAARREAIDDLGGLIEHSILGSADHNMGLALIGQAERSIPEGVTKNYRDLIMNWQERARVHNIQGDIGYCRGTIAHRFHGKKRDRNYIGRWDILINHQFDPLLDIKKDSQGLFVFTDAGLRMRNDIRAYMRARNEDSVDLE